jgi:Flp pilus assembly protein TadD
MRQQSSLARSLVSAVLTATVAATLCGCQTAGMSDITGSISGNKREAAVEADPRRAVETDGERYRADPKNPEAALRYGQALRATGQRTQAVAVLEQASIVNPGNKALLAGYGRALVDNGNFQRAFDVLSTAHSPDNPDWRILSVQGTALDQLGRHDEARSYYHSALKIMPGEPSVLSNLGMSYVLSKELPKAEEALRRAYGRPNADPRVRQNLALVVGLQGRFGEAESIVRADLPPEQAAANVAYLKQMLDRKAHSRAGAPADTGDGVPRS